MSLQKQLCVFCCVFLYSCVLLTAPSTPIFSHFQDEKQDISLLWPYYRICASGVITVFEPDQSASTEVQNSLVTKLIHSRQSFVSHPRLKE